MPPVGLEVVLFFFFSRADCSPPQPVSRVGVDPLFVHETHEPPLFPRTRVGLPGMACAARFNGAAVQEKAMCLEYMHLRNGILVSSPLGVTVCLIRLSSCDCKQTCDYSKMVEIPPHHHHHRHRPPPPPTRSMVLAISGARTECVTQSAPALSNGANMV